MDLFPKFSFSLTDLYQQVSNAGWEVKKIKYDKSSDRFVAKAQATHGEELESWGRNERQAVANLLMNIVHRNGLRSGRTAMWKSTFTGQLKEIAEAYAKAPIYEPKAAISFMELGRDAVMRAKALTEHLDIIVVNNPDPYHDVQKMCDDVRKRRKLEVSRAGIEHPLWSEQQALAFRIAFDVLGYCASGGDWGWEGTNRAFAAYAAIIPAEAQSALFTEILGQTAYATYYRAYGPQKVALFPQFVEEAQRKENPHGGYRGLHPSQIIPPVAMPEAKPPIKARVAATVVPPADSVDINAGWQSPYAANPQMNPPLINYDMEHDRNVLGIDQLRDLGAKLNTGWADKLQGTGTDVLQEWQKLQETDPQEATRIRTAVSNAIRVACLSPRTKLHHNAVQYQDLQNVPYDATDPNDYWTALENARQEWNASRFGDQAREEHRPWFIKPPKDKATGKQDLAPYDKLVKVLYQRDPMGGETAAREEASRLIMEAKATFQAKLEEENAALQNKSEDEAGWLIDNESNKMVVRWIKMITDPNSQHDVYAPSAHEDVAQEWSHAAAKTQQLNMHDYDPSYTGFDNHKIFNLQRYGAFMGTQIKAITMLTRHLEEIVVAALWDVHVHDGTGHHFRTTVLSYDAPNVGPKVVSFMWLLLQPLTSQLATIDVHMSKLLGHSPDDVNARDYFRMERELASRRDAMGLNHVPLGLFQWATWDLQRTGDRSPDAQMALFPDERPEIPLHQDHSALRVLKPTPAWSVPWIPPPPDKRNYQYDFMTATDPASKQAEEDWNNSVATQFGPDVIPHQQSWPTRFAKTASSSLVPWFKHPDTQEQIPGQPGQTIMQLLRSMGLNLADAWKLDETAVGKNLTSAL